MTGDAVEELRGQLSDLLGVIEDHSSQLATIAGRSTGDLPGEARSLDEMFAALELIGPRGELASEALRRRAATDLSIFVEWLIRSHELGDRWPACWKDHRGVLEEVIALRLWHDESRRGVGTAGHNLTYWYSYGLWPFVERTLRSLMDRCGSGGHKDDAEHHIQCASTAVGGLESALEQCTVRVRAEQLEGLASRGLIDSKHRAKHWTFIAARGPAE